MQHDPSCCRKCHYSYPAAAQRNFPKDGVSRWLRFRLQYLDGSPFIYEDVIGVILALSIKEGVAI
jgi:hypothetical protein